MKKLIVILVAGLMAGCGEDPPPEQVKDIHSRIHAVVEDGSVLKIELSARPALTADYHFQNASMDTARISEKLIRYFPETKQEKLVYVLNADVSDKYGNQKETPVLELTYKIDDLRKINYDTIYHRQILEFAEPIHYLGMAGVQIVKAWCDENKDDARRFCAANT